MNTYEVALTYLDELEKEDVLIIVPMDEAMVPVPHHIFHCIVSEEACVFCKLEKSDEVLDDIADYQASISFR